MTDSATTHAIVLEGLCRSFPMGETVVQALSRIDLTVATNEYIAIMGPSGSGKTTLMNIIGLLDRPDSGRYLLNGRAVATLKDAELAKLRNTEIGFVFQTFNLLNRTTALQNVELPLIYRGVGRRDRRRRASEILELVGLSDHSSHRPSEMSGGQRQRVAIARALVTKPSILLADEPTGNLDSKTGDTIMAALAELHEQGQTIILVTHEADIAARAGRQVVLRDGIIASDSKAGVAA